jgi:catechol 2,3-dioxygenase-like lactoylglutathione lyase family enzyme
MKTLAAITFLVRDYDEAIDWFCSKLKFELLEDSRVSDVKRWVRVAAPGKGSCLLLAKAEGRQQVEAIGNAAGGRVAYFLHTANFAEDYAHMTTVGVTFLETPRQEPYGTVAVFADLYGNAWDMIQPSPERP